MQGVNPSKGFQTGLQQALAELALSLCIILALHDANVFLNDTIIGFDCPPPRAYALYMLHVVSLTLRVAGLLLL